MSLAQEEQHLPATQPLPSPLHPQCASATPCAPSGLLSRPQQSKLQPYQRLLAAACKSHAIRRQPHAVLLLHPGPHCIHFPPPWAKACSQSRGLSRGGQVQDKPGLGRLRSQQPCWPEECAWLSHPKPQLHPAPPLCQPCQLCIHYREPCLGQGQRRTGPRGRRGGKGMHPAHNQPSLCPQPLGGACSLPLCRGQLQQPRMSHAALLLVQSLVPRLLHSLSYRWGET